MIDDVGMTGNRQGIPDVVIGNENPDIAFGQTADDLPEVAHGNGIDTAEGFVEEQKSRIGSQGAAYLSTAPLSP